METQSQMDQYAHDIVRLKLKQQLELKVYYDIGDNSKTDPL